jgi:hypothetical protein
MLYDGKINPNLLLLCTLLEKRILSLQHSNHPIHCSIVYTPMKRLLLLLMFIIFTNSTYVLSQSTDPQSITMEVALWQDTVLLGQPFFIDLVFTNHSNETVTLQKKATFQKSQNELLIISSENDTTQVPEINLVKGICPCDVYNSLNLSPGESHSFPMLVDHSANIKKAGIYTAIFSFSVDFVTSNYEGTYQVSAHRQGETTFTVLEDDPKLGIFIDDVANAIFNDYLLQSGICCESQQKNYEYRMLLEAIDDKRVIPHLARAAKLPKMLPLYKTLDLLSRYPFDSTAFSVLKKAAKGPDDTYCAIIRDDSIQVNWEKTGNRQKAIKYIMARNDQQAIDFICTLNNQDFPCERYGILLNARQYFSEENAQQLYAFYLKDKHPAVRQKAWDGFKKGKFMEDAKKRYRANFSRRSVQR